MNCSTTFSMKMESKKMATKALEIMKSVLAQTDADGFEYDSRETFDRFADNLVVKGSEIIDTQSYGLMPETYHIVLPEMFKAVARCFCFDKFSAKIYYDSTYVWENYDINYGSELLSLRLQHFCSGNQMIAQNITHVNCPSGIARLGRNQFDYALLVLHLPVNGDSSILQINITPFQAKGFIDPQATVPPQKVCSFSIGSLEVFIQERKLLMGKGNNVSVILCLHLGHSNLGIFIDTELVVSIHIKIIARICLTKDEVKHFEEALCVLV